jgi:two-component system phosphate regulon sensor histidine kinase PhoR
MVAAVLAGLDLYINRILKRHAADRSIAQLDSTARLLSSKLPPYLNEPALHEWMDWSKQQTGARITLVAQDGAVLADSEGDPQTMENHGSRPEIVEARSKGRGEAIRFSTTVQRDLVYWAVRLDGVEWARYLRLAILPEQHEQAAADIRRNLLYGSLLLLALAFTLSLLFSRHFSTRIRELTEFSGRIAQGQFSPLRYRGAADELHDLARSLNQTAAALCATIERLTEERNRSATILESMVDAVVVVDTAKRVVFGNSAFRRLVEAGEGIAGKDLLEVVRLVGLHTALDDALENKRGVRLHSSGAGTAKGVWDISIAPVMSASGELAGAVAVLHDISEVRRLEQVRRDFIANISHELKTPLATILGFAETLLTGALEDEEHNRRFVAIIREQAAGMAKLTEDLLDLSRIEAGQFKLEFEPVALSESVANAAQAMEPAIKEKRLTLSFDLPASLPRVRADRMRLRQVVAVLLDNAIKYTSQGGRVTVRAFPSEDQKMVTVQVEDTGMGILSTDLPRVFERFYRVDKSRTRQTGGYGLGLAIARHIVEIHGGRIWAESEVGRGSTFSFTMPAAGEPPAA